MSNAIIPSIFTERVCEFPSLQEELKRPSSLLTIVLDGYDNFIKEQANKFQTFLSNCFNKMGHKAQIIIIKYEVCDYPIPKSVKNDTRNIVLHLGNVFFMPCSFNNWTKEYYRDIKRLQTLLEGKKFTSLYEKVVKMRNMAYNFVRLECGILADVSSPLSPTFKYALPLKIKDLLLEYHTNKFPLILNYSHISK